MEVFIKGEENRLGRIWVYLIEDKYLNVLDKVNEVSDKFEKIKCFESCNIICIELVNIVMDYKC